MSVRIFFVLFPLWLVNPSLAISCELPEAKARYDGL